jgi:AcrR family transcriptional regulator
MARPSSIDDEELIARLSEVFREVGYEGASLAMLSEATGLQRASLYYRFPRGKQQMAEEVLRTVVGWAVENIVTPLTSENEMRQRWTVTRRNLDQLYAGGRKSCPLNMLFAPKNADGPLGESIREALGALVSAFAHFARDCGLPRKEAERAGMRAVMLIQGSLVLSRGLGDPRPFRDALKMLEAEFLPDRREGGTD